MAGFFVWVLTPMPEALAASTNKGGLSTPDKINESKIDLPLTTRFVVVEGGNHATFDW